MHHLHFACTPRRRLVALLSVAAALALQAVAAGAAGLDQLKAFLGESHTGRMNFSQVVLARDGRTTQQAEGTFAFARPGRFRWSYDKPFQQLIVGDGDKLWIYDRDLNQVIVKKLDRALGGSPAALLAGDNELERAFELRDAGRGDGVEWVEAKPRAADTGFVMVRIGFRDNLPRTMELIDTFGQTTVLAFRGNERNPALDPGQFRFTTPKGADVVGE